MDLHITQEDKLPTIEMGPDRDVHILHSRPLKPSSRFLKGSDSPNTSSAIEAKEIEKHSIDLLLHFKVEAHIYVLKLGQQVHILIYESPPCLNQAQLRIILQFDHLTLKKTPFFSVKTFSWEILARQMELKQLVQALGLSRNLEVWNCSLEKVGAWFKVSIEDHCKLILLHVVTVHA